ncbi:MAG TPA: hypothetical protein ENG95_02590, partial [Nitrospirae bacterium]|nr:hypothetical protein [Nitrospirota bacterium]
MAIVNNISNSSAPLSNTENTALKRLLSSDKCKDYLKSLSLITGFHLSVYNEKGGLLLTVTENPICKFSETAQSSTANCPGSCEERILEPLKLDRPLICKCRSKVMSFSMPISYLRENAVVVGRNGFACYEDFLEFLKTAKNKDLQEIPITAPLNFVDENYVASISQYIHNVINYMLSNLQEKQKITEKLGRFTSLVDTNILEKLSRDPNSIYRYIIDTIEFILGPTSVAMLALDNRTSTYKAVSASGKHKNAILGLEFSSKSSVIKQIGQTRSPVFRIDLEAEKLIQPGSAGKTRILNLFPVYVGDKMEGLIGVLD